MPAFATLVSLCFQTPALYGHMSEGCRPLLQRERQADFSTRVTSVGTGVPSSPRGPSWCPRSSWGVETADTGVPAVEAAGMQPPHRQGRRLAGRGRAPGLRGGGCRERLTLFAWRGRPLGFPLGPPVGFSLFQLAFDSSNVTSFVRCDGTTPTVTSRPWGTQPFPSPAQDAGPAVRNSWWGWLLSPRARLAASCCGIWSPTSWRGPLLPFLLYLQTGPRGMPWKVGDTGHLASARGHLRGSEPQRKDMFGPAAPSAEWVARRSAPAALSLPRTCSRPLLSCHLGHVVLKPFTATRPCNPFPWLVLLSLLPRHTTTFWEHGRAPGCGGTLQTEKAGDSAAQTSSCRRGSWALSRVTCPLWCRHLGESSTRGRTRPSGPLGE